MRITESQLRRIIRQEAARLTEMPRRRSQDPEMLAAAAAGEKMRTDWESRVAAYDSKSLKIYMFSESYGGYMEGETALGFGLGTSEEEARRDAMKRVPDDAREIESAPARVVSEREYEKELNKLEKEVEQLEVLQRRLGQLDLTDDLYDLGAYNKRR